MSGERKPENPMKSPVEWIFRVSMLLFGAVIALNLTVVFLRPILPWLVGGIALLAATWITVAVLRWRRSRW
jgi:membrane protein YdbS with pleckstrin-like domain